MHKKLLFICLFVITSGTYAQVQPEDSLINLLKVEEGSEKIQILNVLARTFTVNRPDTSLLISGEVLKLLIDNPDKNQQSEALGNMAECYWYMSVFDSSAIFYTAAIRLAEETNDRKKQSRFLNGLGTVLYQMGDPAKALVQMKRASEIKLEDGDLTGYAIISCNMGAALLGLGRSREAVSLLRDAEKRLESSPYKGIRANLYNTLGAVYQSGLNEYDSAAACYTKNIDMLANEPELDAYALSAHHNLGEVYLMKGLTNKAEEEFNKALEISTRLRRRFEQISIYNNLSKVAEARNNYKKALFYKIRQTEINDSVFSEERQTIVQDLETKYRSEKKDARIKQQQLELEIQNNRFLRIILFASIGLLVLIFVLIYLYVQKHNRELIEKTKDRIFQNIVHDIRTPLTLIRGPVEVLKSEENLSPAATENLIRIEKNAGRLMKLADELLLAARLGRNEYSIQQYTGNVSDFCHNITDSFRSEADARNITLLFQSNLMPEALIFPAAALDKILSNLLSNALKFTLPGGIVNVSVTYKDSGIILTVSDTGKGIAKQEIFKLYKRFYRSEKETHTTGFGIGLSIVADLLKLAGGRIETESEEGKGTRFTVFLPAEKIEEPDSLNTGTDDSALILIMEDDTETASFIASLLSTKGFRILRAGNGKDGVKLAEQNLPDLIISDMMMPLMDGAEATEIIKSHPLTAHIPLILLSARSVDTARLEGLNAGADGYLSKPFIPDELTQLVENLLKTSENQRQQIVRNVGNSEKSVSQRIGGDDMYLSGLIKIIEEHLEDAEFSVNELASEANISRSQLHRKITTLTGLSTTHFIRNVRLEFAIDLLRKNAGNVSDVAYACGFTSPSYFSRSFTEYFGKSPSEFLK
jgi:signal transduction histidine kinase/DNA-binding response OmpR family regulator